MTLQANRQAQLDYAPVCLRIMLARFYSLQIFVLFIRLEEPPRVSKRVSLFDHN